MKHLEQRELCLSSFLLVSFLLCIYPAGESSTVFAADVIPAPPPPEQREQNPAPTPVPPAQQRPSIDPGIAIPPPTEPHPESVITPPPIDPKMSIHPEDAPTTKQPSFPSPPSVPSPGATPPN
ncbi:exported hypothetical protein [Candidatus Nitrospira nitrificans]|uniref:Uncharacterized protein n=1 Tax=Candidatus Nitrospira nitrificans TaxID=1742973 RepID=A0A0S4LUP0_9BACT|nr:exported hypothetical protein [Candidatus Nitrospira nitrificans]